jgi:hypothetical protein
MNIREKIYNIIQERGLIDYPEDEKIAKELSEADPKKLLEDIDNCYKKWFEYDQLLEEKHTPELLHQKHVQESSFEIACFALTVKGDPSVIPHFFKYIPLDEWDWNIEVNMEDYNTQNLERCVVNAEYYGEAYVRVILSHIHELVPDKMIEARGFLWQMIWDDFHEFNNSHPLFSNLALPKKTPFLQLLDYSMKCSLEEVEEDDPKEAELFLKKISGFLKNINSESPHFLKLAYLRQEFLKLHAAD